MKSFSFFQKLTLLWRTFIDKRTPWWAKMFVIIAVIYGVFPLDFVPDVIPLFGQLDDMGVIVTLLIMFWNATKKVRSKIHKKSENT